MRERAILNEFSFYEFEYIVVYDTVGCDYGGSLGERGLIAVEVGDPSTRFGDYQRTCGVVPGLQQAFYENVVVSCGEIATVDSGRARSAQILSVFEECSE